MKNYTKCTLEINDRKLCDEIIFSQQTLETSVFISINKYIKILKFIIKN